MTMQKTIYNHDSFMSPAETEYLSGLMTSVKRRTIAAGTGMCVPIMVGASVAVNSGKQHADTLKTNNNTVFFILAIAALVAVVMIIVVFRMGQRNRKKIQEDLATGMKETVETEVLKKVSTGRRRRAANALLPVSKSRRYYYVSTTNGWYEMRLEDFQATPAQGKVSLIMAPVSKVILGVK